ncbi:MAG: NAD(P)/FAD-dependent oxidoreductase [Mycobacteriales bacterium]
MARVVVVGGGVVGLAAAYYLVRGGAQVTVVDSGRVGHAASWGNAGWVAPSLSGPVPGPGVLRYAARSAFHPDSAAYFRPRIDAGLLPWTVRFIRSCNHRHYTEGLEATARLAARTMGLFDGLAADGVTFDMWAAGLSFLALSTEAAQAELDLLAPLRRFGYRLPERLTEGSALRERYPVLSRAVAAGFQVTGERHVDPRTLTAGLAGWLVGAGARVVENTSVSSFPRGDARVTAVETNAGAFPADAVVLAAGAWTGRLLRRLGVRLPLQGGKGYSFSVQLADPPSTPLYLLEAKMGVTPLGGRVRFAGTMEIAGLDNRLDPRRLAAMTRNAQHYVVDWPADTLAEQWAGLRPMTGDGLPVIGPAPGVPNVFIATGHAMLGVTLAPATGEALSRLVLNGETDTVLAPFGVERFQIPVSRLVRRYRTATTGETFSCSSTSAFVSWPSSPIEGPVAATQRS